MLRPGLMLIALVLSPTRELATQIQSVIMALGDYMNVQCHACIGGTNVGEDIRKLDYGQHVVSGTPGRVADMIRRRNLRTSAPTPRAAISCAVTRETGVVTRHGLAAPHSAASMLAVLMPPAQIAISGVATLTQAELPALVSPSWRPKYRPSASRILPATAVPTNTRAGQNPNSP